jgi:hypothetical protein
MLKLADEAERFVAKNRLCRGPEVSAEYAAFVPQLASALRQAVARVMELEREVHDVTAFMDGIRNEARNRNPAGATILDFMAVWNEQYEKRLATTPDWHAKPTCAGVWIYATSTLFHKFALDLKINGAATEHDRCKLWYGPIPNPPKENS